MSETTDLGAILDAGPAAHEAPMAPMAEQEPQVTGDKQQTAEPPAAAKPEGQEPGHIPREALLDERRKRQEIERKYLELEARLNNPQQPQQEQAKPDWFANPEEAAAYMRQEIERQNFETRIVLSEQIMAEKHSDYEQMRDTFAEAAAKSPHLAQQLVQAPNPARFAYEMGKRIALANEIGGDPQSYKAKLEAEFRQKYGIPDEPNGQPSAPQQRMPAPAAPVPKSLAKTPSAQPRNQVGQFAQKGPTPLEDIIG